MWSNQKFVSKADCILRVGDTAQMQTCVETRDQNWSLNRLGSVILKWEKTAMV
jgi:hypothetical protein